MNVKTTRIRLILVVRFCHKLLKKLLLLYFSVLPLLLFGQGKNLITIERSREGTYEESGGSKIRKLLGDVILRQNDVQLFCDSAYLYVDQNKATAFGKVRILQPGKMDARSRYLEYDGNSKDAYLKGEVVVTDGEMTLRTDILYYNTANKIARYNTPAVITNAEAVLKSKNGLYDSNLKKLFFQKNVTLDHPDFRLTGDTLHYHTLLKKADFFGPTYIYSDRSTTYTEGGWFKTQTRESFLTKNGQVAIDSHQFIRADTIYFNDSLQRGYCIGGVQVIDTLEKTEVRGGYTRFDRKKGTSVVYNFPILMNFSDPDTLYLTADTIYQNRIGDSTNVLLAHFLPVIQKSDLLLLCDSLSYVETDSVFRFYRNPVIWSAEFQITSEFMELYTKGKDFDRLEMYRDGLMVKEEDSLRYSQVKGKDMTAWFENRQMARIDIKGNGQSIYYVEREDGSLMGANKIESSDITILLEDNRPVDIRFYVQPVAVLHPIDQVNPLEFRLKGFKWEADRKKLASFRMEEAFICNPERGLYKLLNPQPVADQPTPAAPPPALMPETE